MEGGECNGPCHNVRFLLVQKARPARNINRREREREKEKEKKKKKKKRKLCFVVWFVLLILG